MPSRWFVPVPALDPARVRPHFVHSAFTAWFDHTGPEHYSGEKPYSVSLLTRDDHGRTGVEIATLTEEAEQRLKTAVKARTPVRLGNQIREVQQPVLERHETWEQLAQHSGATQWRLDLVTPATWRTGDRASPLPDPRTIVKNLTQAWVAWGTIDLPPAEGSVWISDLDLRSEPLRLRIGGTGGCPLDITVPGVTGTLVLRPTGPPASLDSLVRLAAYTGIGSFTRRGLGVTRVACLTRRPTE